MKVHTDSQRITIIDDTPMQIDAGSPCRDNCYVSSFKNIKLIYIFFHSYKTHIYSQMIKTNKEKTDMNNDKIEITLNEEYKRFPVISYESFLDLLEVSVKAIKDDEPNIKDIIVDRKTDTLSIVTTSNFVDITDTTSILRLYSVFCKAQEYKTQVLQMFPMLSAMDLEMLVNKQIEAVPLVASYTMKRMLEKTVKYLRDNEDPKDFFNYDKVKGRLIAVPVNGNNFDKDTYVFKEVASGLGYTANIYLYEEDEIVSTCGITKKMLFAYDISIDELMATALARTLTLYGPTANICEEFGCYVLTANNFFDFGAIAAFYPGVLKSVADKFNDDMIVFFTSTSEVICVARNGLAGIPFWKNPSILLADQAFVYERQQDKLIKL